MLAVGAATHLLTDALLTKPWTPVRGPVAANSLSPVDADLYQSIEPGPTLGPSFSLVAFGSLRARGFAAALSTIGVVESGTVRVLCTTDTMRLHRLYASTALIEEARERDDLRVVESPPIEFADDEFLPPSPD